MKKRLLIGFVSLCIVGVLVGVYFLIQASMENTMYQFILGFLLIGLVVVLSSLFKSKEVREAQNKNDRYNY